MTVDPKALEVAENASSAESTATFEDDRDGQAERDEPRSEQHRPTTSGFRQAVKSKVIPILLGVALVASAAVAAVLYFVDYRTDQQTDHKAADIAIDAAKQGTIALLSYAPDSLDKDFANAKSHLTGDFLSYYNDFTAKVVAPASQQKKVKTSAAVGQGAVVELKPDSAVVLLFVNQTTTSQENPDGSFAVSTVKVGMDKVDGNWLISTFDPV